MTPLRTIFTRATAPRAGAAISNRHVAALRSQLLHQSAAARQPYKDDMDRESLKPKAHENTQSGTDDQVAHDDEAFNPDNTDPDSERAAAAAGSKSSSGDGGSPLEESPANKGFASNATGSREDRRPGGGGDHSKPSAKGDPPKHGKV